MPDYVRIARELDSMRTVSSFPAWMVCGHRSHVGTCPACQRTAAAKLAEQNRVCSAIAAQRP